MRQIEGENRVARLQAGEVDGHVGLGARMRLDVGLLGPEELLHALDGQSLRHVHVLAAAVITPAGIALGILVREHRPLGRHDGGAGVVLGCDHLQPVLLAALLILDGLPDLGVAVLQDVHGPSS